jgi:hypothetical protein
MKSILHALALVVTMGASASISVAAPFPMPPDDVFGTSTPKRVTNWLRLSVLGNTYHPFLIIWISPQAFHRSGFERLVVLSPREYKNLSAFANSYTCSNSIGKNPEHTLWITQYSAGQTRSVCVLPHASACAFLTEASALPNISWTEKKVMPIRDIALDIGCSE